VIILAAKLEVTHDDCDFSASEDENNEDDGQESKDVIELMQPDRRENEEEFDEDCTEGKNASHENREKGFHVPNLLGNLSWDLIGSNTNLLRGFLESIIASEENEWDRNAKPQANQCQESSKRNGSNRFLNLENKVQEEEYAENRSRKQC